MNIVRTMRRILTRHFSVVHPEFEPHSVIKVISRNKEQKKKPQQHEKPAVTSKKSEIPNQNGTETNSTNVNEMGIQMISEKLFKQIFANTKPSSIDPDLIDR